MRTRLRNGVAAVASATLLAVLLAGCTIGPQVTNTVLPDAARNVAYSATLVATGGKTPFTWSVTNGSLPAGLTLAGSTGKITGKPTALGTSTFTVTATTSDNKTATKSLSISVINPGTWAQVGNDPGRRSFAGAELALTPANVSGAHQEWDVPINVSAPVAAGGLVYVNGLKPETSDPALMAFDQSNGALAWSVPLAQTCTTGRVALTATQVISACGTGLEAYRLAAPHDLLWSTADTDPGVNPTDVLIDGSMVVVSDSTSVTAYSLADGQRQWGQIAPDNGTVVGISASANTVVATYSDRITAYALNDGSFKWEHTVSYGVPTVVADGWVYTADGGLTTRFAVDTGKQGWTAKADPNGSSAVGVFAVDGTTVYTEWDITGEFDVTRVIRALRSSDGSLAWEQTANDAIESMAVVGNLFWVATSARGIYSDRSSNLTAYAPADGSLLANVSFTARAYQPVAFANGHALLAIDGLVSVGLAPPTPVITTKLLKSGRVGSAYSEQLAATTGTAPYRWTVASGTLPAGLSLSTSGAITGTPTAAGTPSVTFRVTDAKSATATRAINLAVSGAPGTSQWNTVGHDGARDAFNADETAVGLSNVQQVAARWKTAAYGAGVYPVGYPEPISVGGKLFATGRDGVLRAFDATGTTTNRAALWSASADANEKFVSGPTESGGTIFVIGSDHAIYSIRTSDGVRLHRTVTDTGVTADNQTSPAPVVIGSMVVVAVNGYPNGELWAMSASTGALAWGGTSRSMVYVPWYYTGQEMATDGTRLFYAADCRVVAVNASDGSAAWDQTLLFHADDYCAFDQALTGVTYADGAVYAGGFASTAALDATTGAVRWRTAQGIEDGAAVSNGALIVERIVNVTEFGWSLDVSALDLRTGALLWSTSDANPASSPSVAGDLVFIESLDGYLRAFDIRTGARKLNLLVSTGGYQVGRPIVSAGRIFANSEDGTIRALGPP
ncbi:MAG: PQQ-binding-like beta-propeller repeat protein [Acidimicrobiia bacterium]|nr:PQQ-binding-like beta-propeller repeat protein [Acidimicrobiia bacterium]